VNERRRVVQLSVLGAAGVLVLSLTAFSKFLPWIRFALAILFGAIAVAFALLLPQSVKPIFKAMAAVFLPAVGLFMGFAILQDSSTPAAKLPSCNDVGNSSSGLKDTTYYAAFHDAYDEAGGMSVLGCPRDNDGSGYVHKWGEGYSQDFKGRKGYPARLMVLPPSSRVVVLKEKLNRDYTSQFDRNTAPEIGYPTTDPRQCGKAKIVFLAKGIWAPGAMVTSPGPEKWIWLARPFWQRYQKLGGPLGRLGLPVGQSDITAVRPVQRFEHGSLQLDRGKRTASTDRELSGKRERAPVRPLPSCLTAPK
jgi:hypothetical protein